MSSRVSLRSGRSSYLVRIWFIVFVSSLCLSAVRLSVYSSLARALISLSSFTTSRCRVSGSIGDRSTSVAKCRVSLSSFKSTAQEGHVYICFCASATLCCRCFSTSSVFECSSRSSLCERSMTTSWASSFSFVSRRSMSRTVSSSSLIVELH